MLLISFTINKLKRLRAREASSHKEFFVFDDA